MRETFLSCSKWLLQGFPQKLFRTHFLQYSSSSLETLFPKFLLDYNQIFHELFQQSIQVFFQDFSKKKALWEFFEGSIWRILQDSYMNPPWIPPTISTCLGIVQNASYMGFGMDFDKTLSRNSSKHSSRNISKNCSKESVPWNLG